MWIKDKLGRRARRDPGSSGGGRLTSPALNWSEEDDMRVNMQSRAGQRARGKQGKGWRWRQEENGGRGGIVLVGKAGQSREYLGEGVVVEEGRRGAVQGVVGGGEKSRGCNGGGEGRTERHKRVSGKSHNIKHREEKSYQTREKTGETRSVCYSHSRSDITYNGYSSLPLSPTYPSPPHLYPTHHHATPTLLITSPPLPYSSPRHPYPTHHLPTPTLPITSPPLPYPLVSAYLPAHLTSVDTSLAGSTSSKKGHIHQKVASHHSMMKTELSANMSPTNKTFTAR
ncbi:hypothetical protein Pcinc_042944 [Petrolisthes cinctipes]|uniref:Uncharacterized protein n=1 Tax=Petrolisthes cinctipes TaxID=88211 RepID=A0AAE1EFJ4_PETCI|nr:hypothetical protein Pcinc_042944 [Petrolisthes cinctipes]